MQVLKCQRPAKSCVILRIVWCNLRKQRLRQRRLGRNRSLSCPAANRFTVAHDQPVNPAEEAADSRHPILLPVEVAVGRGGKKGVHAGGVGSIAGNHIVGRDHVALGLGHLGAIADDHSLGKEAGHRLVIADQSQIAHDPGPEAGVDQVQDGVFYSADVLIDRKPVVDLLPAEGSGRVVSIRVAVEIPGGVDKRVHGIGLAPRGSSTAGTGRIHKSGNPAQRRTVLLGNLDLLRKQDRKLVVGHGHDAVFRAIKNGNGRAPIALTADAPILQTIGNRWLPKAMFLGDGG